MQYKVRMQYKSTILRDLNDNDLTQLCSLSDVELLMGWMVRPGARSFMHPDTFSLLKAAFPKMSWYGVIYTRIWMPENTVILYEDGVPWVYALPSIPLMDVF